MQAEDNSVSETLTLPAVLDLRAAADFLRTMQEKSKAQRVLIDASGVETLTFPCVQIILAAVRDHAAISIERPSIAFASAFHDLGLDWTGGQSVAPAPSTEEIPGQVAGHDAGERADHEQTDVQTMKKRILTIDDSKTMRDMLMLTLAEAGFEVLQAVDGKDGLDVLAKERVDIIVTDINMPRMDGYDVIRQVRSDPLHKATPILVLTTESDTEKKTLARSAGATGWMVKPFDPDRLVATIRKVAP